MPDDRKMYRPLIVLNGLPHDIHATVCPAIIHNNTFKISLGMALYYHRFYAPLYKRLHVVDGYDNRYTNHLRRFLVI